MSEMSYISVIERYHDHKAFIRELLASIITGVADKKLCATETAMQETVSSLAEHYPFVDSIYLLDDSGKQVSPFIGKQGVRSVPGQTAGVDRSQRPYFQQAKQNEPGVTVSNPYFSNVSRNLCVTAMAKCGDEGTASGYVVADIDLRQIIQFLMGDTLRARFNPAFKVIYSLIVLGLFAIVGILLWSAFSEVVMLFSGAHSSESLYLKPFHVIIFLTLALAVFDLGKTIFEEEVLMHKDIFRHSSTRRTITRFVAAILIAVSIESLLLMFKSTLSDNENIRNAVWMMFSAIGLLVGLGIYVYLGARAEAYLRQGYTINDEG